MKLELSRTHTHVHYIRYFSTMYIVTIKGKALFWVTVYSKHTQYEPHCYIHTEHLSHSTNCDEDAEIFRTLIHSLMLRSLSMHKISALSLGACSLGIWPESPEQYWDFFFCRQQWHIIYRVIIKVRNDYGTFSKSLATQLECDLWSCCCQTDS